MTTASTPESTFSGSTSGSFKHSRFSHTFTHRPIALHRLGLFALFSSLAIVLGIGEGAIAAPEADSSSRTRVSQTGDVYEILGGFDRGDGNGGGNLFHSFESFDIDRGEQVIFRQGNDFENIIGRVVGGNGTDINGMLSVDGTANLFLLDPQGIVFKENAQLDLRGSFIASTADEISFGDRGSFSFNERRPDADLTITPDALVFNQLANLPAINERGITVRAGKRNRIENIIDDVVNSIDEGTFDPNQDEIDFDPANDNGLVVNGGRSILLAGGPIDIDDGILRVNNGRGRIEISAFGDAGELPITTDVQGNSFQIDRQELSDQDDITRADIRIRNGSALDVTGQNNGNITLSGDSIEVSGLSSICAGIGPGLACNLLQRQSPENSEEELELMAEVFSNLPEFGTGDARAGNIFLSTDSAVTISDGSQLTNGVYEGSRAQAKEDSRDAFQNLIQVFSNQDELDLDQLFASVIIEASSITIDGSRDNADVSSRVIASIGGEGNAGLVFLAASESIDIIGEPVSSALDAGEDAQVQSIVGRNAVGDAGGIVISTPVLRLSDAAYIVASTFGEGKPGNIDIFTNDPTTSASNDGIVDLSGTSLILSNVERGGDGGALPNQDDLRSIPVADAESLRESDEGAISIRARSVRLSDVSQIQTIVRGNEEDPMNVGRGDAGTILVIADELIADGSQDVIIDGQLEPYSSGILSSVDANAIGDGGLVFVIADDVILDNGGAISVQTEGQGGLTLNQDGDDVETPTSTGGRVLLITLDDLGLLDGGRITASASGDNIAGDIFILTGGLQVVRDSSFIDATTLSGEGGNVFTFGNALFLADGGNITTRAGNDQDRIGGDGGNIDLDLDIVVASPFNDNNINAEAFDGTGGNIFTDYINLQEIAERDEDVPSSNDITASSEFGTDGVVSINELDVDPVRGVLELPALVVDVESLLIQACPGLGQRDNPELGEFYVTGRGGLPPSIGDRPNTNDIFADWVSFTDSANELATIQSPPEPFTISESASEPAAVEAQELVEDANGDLWLVADANAAAIPPPSPRVCPS